MLAISRESTLEVVAELGPEAQQRALSALQPKSAVALGAGRGQLRDRGSGGVAHRSSNTTGTRSGSGK